MVRNTLTFMLVATMLVTLTNAKTYIVGDNITNGWRTGINYAAWTSGKSFRVGDFLNFYYDASQYDVIQVSKSDYDTCSSSNPITSDNTGFSTLILKDLGTVYIISGAEGTCNQGMKMQVNIVGYASSGYKFKSVGYFAVGFSLFMMMMGVI